MSVPEFEDVILPESTIEETKLMCNEAMKTWLRPIVVGYVFGPKKMSTMGVVMAEASKTKLTTLVPSSYIEEHLVSSLSNDQTATQLTSDALNRYVDIDDVNNYVSADNYSSHDTNGKHIRDSIVFSLDANDNATSQTGNGLRDIVRYFRSSCSSVCDSESTGTCTASTISQLTTGTALYAASTSVSSATTAAGLTSNSNHTIMSQKHQVRVSFVPLDPEIPLEEQHDGRIDVILHKLTEDILCLSQLNGLSAETLRNGKTKCLPHWSLQDRAAVNRIQNLCRFSLEHQCCLVDDPLCVQTLMSRSDIADTLGDCLQEVFLNGRPVSTPKYAVIYDNDEPLPTNLNLPLIIKPLTAAGTKASHSMGIVLHKSAWQNIIKKMSPCLVQEYENHNALMYKVYVLGQHVSVHKRRSLPNLPPLCEQVRSVPMVEFDSQRPYPRLNEFGYDIDRCTNNNNNSNEFNITEADLSPLVTLLKQAFGLELFGFDVLVTTDLPFQQILVVDVNYFPSYKEVPNFPALLAQYLTDRAIASRKAKQRSSTRKN